MKLGSTYQLRTPTLAFFIDNEHHRIPVTVPAKATVIPQQVDGPMVEVRWDGLTVTMFIIDLQQRGRIVSAAAA